MPTILSTKVLSPSQKQLVLNGGIGFVEYDAIKIDFTDFNLAAPVKNAIVTSKNAAKAIQTKGILAEKCFCVGNKTSAYLKVHGYEVVAIENYGADLAKLIFEKHREEKFTFFCGNKRRDEIPSALKKHHIAFEEIEVYKTSLNFQQFQQEFEGVLFFSPSAVQSYTKNNKLKDSIAFCIGETTASEAKKHTGNIVVANSPGIENVIVQVVKYFRR
ncbi:uroporphyrinogen-III synthase [Zunongwangia sp. F363]|uniref:Uroporphyrinogen-III synthase n=1 Tax=Autumnicola tepida TaxID=3075595 RepID=A0ABU3C713_9FLAO|nr:uroporphyrinogen-III synthase [Zunongwangia sp. F363]MDT0642104.1 uroporphyrinogen-III synthase [Zunongwangia sp. F363]